MERRGAGIKIEGLRKVYQTASTPTIAIDQIDLAIEPGQFICIVGPSGCGKSTLLRILAGLETQTSGTIQVDSSGWAVQNAMVFQDSGLFPWMNVETNVGFGLMTRGVDKAEIAVRVEEALKLVGLTRFRTHYPHQLSGGMRQRVSIARALVVDPTVLLMDEPFAALDAQNRGMMQAEMIRILNEESKTVVLVTHSIEEAINLSDVIVVMTRRPGRVKEIIRVPEPRRMVEDTPAYLAIRRQIRDLIAGEHDVSEAV